MEKFIINNVEVLDNLVKINFTPSKNIQKYFKEENTFFIEYNCDISKTPKSIAVIPLIASILPMTWFTNTEIVVDELDEDFYNSLENIKKGYMDMVPNLSYGGKVFAKKIVKNIYSQNNDKKLLFFSAGVDSYYSYTKHYNENLEFLSIWGSDIFLNQESGWIVLKNLIKENTEKENKQIVQNNAKTNFRNFLNYEPLAELVKDSGDEYWHGFQHSIGIICLSAPLIFTKEIKTVYFASTLTKETLNITCASRPAIDESVKIAETSIVHDGFEANRLQKVLSIVNFYKNKQKPKIHVCWVQQTGLNCGTCEKCTRTILEILCLGGNPSDFGIPYTEQTINDIKARLLDGSLKLTNLHFLDCIDQMQNHIKTHKKLKKNKDINWILDINTSIGQYIPSQPNSIFFRIKRKLKHIAKKILRRK